MRRPWVSALGAAALLLALAAPAFSMVLGNSMQRQFDPTHEIRFQSLFRERGLCFPCDERGHVELDALSDRARENYLYARAVVGVEFSHPQVCPAAPVTR